MEKAIRNFLWTGSIHCKKVILINWDTCCSPIDEGGIGLKRLFCLNKALLGRVAWKLYCHSSFVYVFLHNRFLKNGTPKASYVCSSLWPSLKNIFLGFSEFFTMVAIL